MKLITLENISKHFYWFKAQKNFLIKKVVLKDISLTLVEKEIVCLIGKNGSGKTTLFNIVANNLKMNKGRIVFHYKYKKNCFEKFAYVYQENKFPAFFSVKEFANLAIAMIRNPDLEYIAKLKQELNLAKIWNNKITKCSGGEKQQINLFSVLLDKPKILLLDEITNNLDYTAQSFIKKFLLDYVNKYNAGILLSSHNIDEALEMATTFHLIDDGKIIKTYQTKKINKEIIKKELIAFFLNC